MTIDLNPIILSLSVGNVEQAQKTFNSVRDKLPKGLSEAITTIFNSKSETTQKALKPQVMARQIRRISGKPASALETPDSIIHILSYLKPNEMVLMRRINRLWNKLMEQALIHQLNDPLRVDIDENGYRQGRNAICTKQIENYRKAGLKTDTIFKSLGCQLKTLKLNRLHNKHAPLDRSSYLAEINKECPNIEHLSLLNYATNEFQHQQFLALAGSQKSLSTLVLSEVCMSRDVFARLDHFRSLTSLILSPIPVLVEQSFALTVDDCAVFKEIPNLKSLSLINFEFNDDLMPHIIRCAKLKSLSLSHMNNLTDRSLARLSQAPNLTIFVLESCFSIYGTQLNEGFPKLKALILSNMFQFSREGLTLFVQNSLSLIKLNIVFQQQPSSRYVEAQEIVRSRREALIAKK